MIAGYDLAHLTQLVIDLQAYTHARVHTAISASWLCSNDLGGSFIQYGFFSKNVLMMR